MGLRIQVGVASVALPQSLALPVPFWPASRQAGRGWYYATTNLKHADVCSAGDIESGRVPQPVMCQAVRVTEGCKPTSVYTQYSSSVWSGFTCSRNGAGNGVPPRWVLPIVASFCNRLVLITKATTGSVDLSNLPKPVRTLCRHRGFESRDAQPIALISEWKRLTWVSGGIFSQSRTALCTFRSIFSSCYHYVVDLGYQVGKKRNHALLWFKGSLCNRFRISNATQTIAHRGS